MFSATDASSFPVWGIALFVVLMIWSFVWKGLALYRAGANRSVGWFVVLLLLNTLGILEILYLFVFSQKPPPRES